MLSIGALALAASAADAATTNYSVNQAIGLGSVVGTIQTNGNLGVLSQSDVTGFNLLVSGPGASVELTDANSIFIDSGANFSATASDLLFDYDGAAGYLLFQFESFGTGMKYYCNASVAGTCFQGASAIPESFDGASAQVEARIGTRVIASVAMVPEPAGWALMLAGFGIVGTALRRRLRATPAVA